MRFNLQEIVGSRARLRYRVELAYQVLGASSFLCNVHAANTQRQVIVEETFATSPALPFKIEQDTVTANRIVAFDSPPGSLVVRYSAVVDVSHAIVDPNDVTAELPSSLPVGTLRYLYPSRYCQADLVQQQAWDRFGQMPRGYAQVRAVRDWVQQSLRFQPGSSHSSTSVLDTLRDRAGVCRDFAHTMIAFCRALNYPSRFATGIDYGADPSLGPTDFHAYVEVYVGGAWYLFDPTGISPVTGLVRIGTGRDAADVSFATIFGPVSTSMPKVDVSADDDPVNGFQLPLPTDLAVSTAN